MTIIRHPSAAHSLFDTAAPKKPTNVTINSDLLRLVREMNVNLSQTLEERLVEIVREEAQKRWLAENAAAIRDYNARVERMGVYSDGVRRF
jgi:antitoxin CcdA